MRESTSRTRSAGPALSVEPEPEPPEPDGGGDDGCGSEGGGEPGSPPGRGFGWPADVTLIVPFMFECSEQKKA